MLGIHPTPPPNFRTAALRSTLLAITYIVFGTLGLRTQAVSDLATYIWIPTGLSIAAATLYGRDIIPGIILGALVTNLLAGATLIQSASIAIGNLLEALAASWILRRDPAFSSSLSRVRDVVRLIFVAAPFATLLSSIPGSWIASSRHAATYSFQRVWLTWWIGDIVGAIVVAPLALTWLTRKHRPLAGSPMEAAAGAIAFALTVGIVFFSTQSRTNPTHALTFVGYPFLVWAALRFGSRGVATLSFLLTTAAIIATTHDLGPFSELDLTLSLFYLDTFVIVACSTGLLLTAEASERRDALEAVVVREALQEYVDSMTTISAKITPDGRVLLANRAASFQGDLADNGAGTTTFVDGLIWREDPAARAQIAAAVDRAACGQAVRETVKTKCAKGNILWHSIQLTPIHTPSGAVSYIVAEATDITLEKKIESDLRGSQALLAEAQELAQVGSWEWDVSTNRLEWSDELYAIYGLQRSELPPDFEGFLGHVHPGDANTVMRKALEAITQGKSFDLPERVIRPDGSIRILESHGRAIRNGGGRVSRIIGTCQDVTDRKKAERERAELLARAQQALWEAESANRTKDRFLAVVSHELRTPLTTILSWAQLLQLKIGEADRLERGLKMIERSALMQVDMINELLDISRLGAGRVSLQVEPLDPFQALRTASENLRLVAEEKGIQLEVLPTQGLPPEIEADARRLQQVLLNLISNAISFTPRGGRILLRAEPLSRSGTDCVRFIVSDTGSGIERELLPRIFQPFTQADSSRTRSHGGLGIGLTIVKQLAELHGGSVEAQSAGPGKGATFIVDLPVRSTAKPTPPTLGPASVPTDVLSGIRLIFVDDDPSTREAIAEALEVRGAWVITAASADEALERLRDSTPDVIVSDIAMPGEDGYALLRRIRSLLPSPARDVPAISLSAYTGPEDIRASREAGFLSHVAKPIDMATLTREILAALQAPRLKAG